MPESVSALRSTGVAASSARTLASCWLCTTIADDDEDDDDEDDDDEDDDAADDDTWLGTRAVLDGGWSRSLMSDELEPDGKADRFEKDDMLDDMVLVMAALLPPPPPPP